MSVNTFWTILLDHPRPARRGAARRADPSGDGGAMPVQAGGRRPASSTASARCRRPAMPPRSASCGSSLSSWVVDLHQVPHPHPHPDRAGRLLEDARLLRAEGARRHDRAWGCCLPTGTSGRTPAMPQFDSARKWLTVVLAVMCWFIFIVGHCRQQRAGVLDHEHDNHNDHRQPVRLRRWPRRPSSWPLRSSSRLPRRSSMCSATSWACRCSPTIRRPTASIWSGRPAAAAKARRCTGMAGPPRRMIGRTVLGALATLLPERVVKAIPLALIWVSADPGVDPAGLVAEAVLGQGRRLVRAVA